MLESTKANLNSGLRIWWSENLAEEKDLFKTFDNVEKM